ncbi:MAG TPA: tRNA pseudouridine(38-40) synthase TruA [Gemmatimonadales bacterium]|jgi:tRNA pseudouridine38-40 synthase|nr:tRNA pseudouridine(38-40) synthase TruA [Gemmatimonadales bacterium]
MNRTFLALLQFDGRGFQGWQRQAVGRTVQGEVERVLERLAGQHVTAHGAGRTDAGVHADAMGVSFLFSDRWTSTELRRALNALLPPDCRVMAIHTMIDDFHARKSAHSRRYRYVIGTDDGSASPFRHPFEWALGRPVRMELLGACARQLAGVHDFEAFSVRGQPRAHHRCDVHLAEWRPRAADRGVEFHIQANRFLHHMVRMLVGTMVDIGLERRPVGDFARLLASRDNQDTSAPAPPQGLYFARVEYPVSAYLEHRPADAVAAS